MGCIITLGTASGDTDVECAKIQKIDPNQPCSAASLAIYEDFLAKCAGTGSNLVPAIKAMKQQCSGGGNLRGTGSSAKCGMAGVKIGKLDYNQPCSAASLAAYDDFLANCKGQSAQSNRFSQKDIDGIKAMK